MLCLFPPLQAMEAPVQAAAKLVRMRAHMLAGLIGLTALSGAFVAGMDAGHAFNECGRFLLCPSPTTITSFSATQNNARKTRRK